MPTPIRDLSGQTFGMLIVKGRHGTASPVRYDCECACGNSKVAVASELRRGSTTNCGCIPRNMANMVGVKYGMLTGLFPSTERRGKNKAILWVFQCECGDICVKQGSSVRAGVTTSCGCLNGYRQEHGGSGTAEYNAWIALKAAHSLPPEWKYFEKFLEDVGKKPSPEHHLDRRDIRQEHSTENTYWRHPNKRKELNCEDCYDTIGLDITSLILSSTGASNQTRTAVA